jgi:hypothetical protein
LCGSSARRALSKCIECTEGTLLSLEDKRSVTGKTFTGLLNTLQAQQGVLEQEVSKRALISLQGEKGTETLEV